MTGNGSAYTNSSTLGSPQKSSNKSSRLGSVTSDSKHRHQDVARTDSNANGVNAVSIPADSVAESESSSDDTITMVLTLDLIE